MLNLQIINYCINIINMYTSDDLEYMLQVLKDAKKLGDQDYIARVKKHIEQLQIIPGDQDPRRRKGEECKLSLPQMDPMSCRGDFMTKCVRDPEDNVLKCCSNINGKYDCKPGPPINPILQFPVIKSTIITASTKPTSKTLPEQSDEQSEQSEQTGGSHNIQNSKLNEYLFSMQISRNNNMKSNNRKSHRKRVKSAYSMKSKNLFDKYAQLGGSLEEEVEAKRKEIKELEAQLAAERSEERKQRIKQSLEDAKKRMSEVQERMKEMLKNVAEKTQQAASKLSSGVSSLASKLSTGASTVASKLSTGASTVASKLSTGVSTLAQKMGITELYNKYKDEQVIKDYYSLKAKVVGQIEMLKRLKIKKDTVCKTFGEKECNNVYKGNEKLFVDESIGGVPRLFYS
jgi:hypothetical protein